jgi:predicted MPP superfamily phosphohydrolase
MSEDPQFRSRSSLVANGRSRRQALGGVTALAGLGVGVFSYAFLREPLRVHLDRHTVHIPNAEGRLPARGLRVLHLSDTHFRGAEWRERAKIDSIRRTCAGLEYDILVHTGDFLHTDTGLPNVLALIDFLPAPRLGGYAVLGNHDYTTYSAREMFSRSWGNFNRLENGYHRNGSGHNPLYRMNRLIQFGRYFANAPLDLRRTGQNDTAVLERELGARNIQLLHNRHVRLEHAASNGECVDIYIAGVDDLTEGAPDLGRALAAVPKTATTLLLSHNPDILGEPDIGQADLVLSGHTHGGQIVLPWLGAAHTHSEHLTRREASGFLRRGATQVYISRGVGEGIPLRFAAAPQIALLTLLPG